METAVSTKIVEEIINYAQNKIDTPFDYWGHHQKLLKSGASDELRRDMLYTMEESDKCEKSAMKHILDIIQKHLK